MTDTPLILFGAFDRHNFGDLLLAHVATRHGAATFPGRPLVFAGAAERDLRPWGGHEVQAISHLAKDWGNRPADLWHVGGETLTCSLYEAAIMTLSPAEARQAIARHDADQEARLAWAREQTGLRQQVAYLVPKALFQQPGRFSYRAVGGVDLPNLPPDMREEIRARLAEADEISVRDRATRSHLAAWGIRAALLPDPGELVAALFGDIIARHTTSGAVAAVVEAFPQGYVAVQFSADFGDDATLRGIAGQLDRIAGETGLGLCFFLAGAAPWHDDTSVYRRLLAFMETRRARLFDSLYLWDICALLSAARAYCGSSLHGRIVGKAFRVPCISLSRLSRGAISKVRAYAETWWSPEGAGPVPPEEIHRTLMTALAQ